MFNNHIDEEADFCESYKSQILNNNTTKKSSSFNIILKILTILLLLALIVFVSIYGYNYFVKNNPSSTEMGQLPPESIQVSDEELKVVIEEESPPMPVSIQEKMPNTKEEEADVQQLADDVKIAIASSEEEINSTQKPLPKEEKKVQSEKNLTKEEESLEVPSTSQSLEAQYLEELADLSRQIEKEKQ